MKKVKIVITKKMADELNAVQDKCFTKKEQELLNCKRFKEEELEAYYG